MLPAMAWEHSTGFVLQPTLLTFFAIAFVTLKEGPSLQTNIVDCDMDKLKIGQKVKVVWKPTDGAPLPFFTPA